MARTKNNEVSNLKEELNNILSQLEDLGYDEASKLKNAATKYLSNAGDRAMEIGEDIKHKANDVKDKSQDYAENHPWNLAIFSLITGFVIGLFVNKTLDEKR